MGLTGREAKKLRTGNGWRIPSKKSSGYLAKPPLPVKADEALHGRCDSFVVETDVHYPTDISLLFDASRKVIELSARLCAEQGMSDWRQHAYNLSQLKRQLRAAQNAKRSKARDDAQKEKNVARIIEAHSAYLELAQGYELATGQVKASAPLLPDAELLEGFRGFCRECWQASHELVAAAKEEQGKRKM